MPTSVIVFASLVGWAYLVTYNYVVELIVFSDIVNDICMLVPGSFNDMKVLLNNNHCSLPS